MPSGPRAVDLITQCLLIRWLKAEDTSEKHRQRFASSRIRDIWAQIGPLWPADFHQAVSKRPSTTSGSAAPNPVRRVGNVNPPWVAMRLTGSLQSVYPRATQTANLKCINGSRNQIADDAFELVRICSPTLARSNDIGSWRVTHSVIPRLRNPRDLDLHLARVRSDSTANVFPCHRYSSPQHSAHVRYTSWSRRSEDFSTLETAECLQLFYRSFFTLINKDRQPAKIFRRFTFFASPDSGAIPVAISYFPDGSHSCWERRRDRDIQGALSRILVL
jgi:hypothetical protein